MPFLVEVHVAFYYLEICWCSKFESSDTARWVALALSCVVSPLLVIDGPLWCPSMIYQLIFQNLVVGQSRVQSRGLRLAGCALEIVCELISGGKQVQVLLHRAQVTTHTEKMQNTRKCESLQICSTVTPLKLQKEESFSNRSFMCPFVSFFLCIDYLD